jgi:hypothetical protein
VSFKGTSPPQPPPAADEGSPTILVLLDYRGHFWMSRRMKDVGMDLEALEAAFAHRGLSVEFLRFPEVDLRSRSYTGLPVLYQSSEDRDSLYKGYIEDVVLALALQGAIVLPGYEYLRAHNNKVFMELLRDLHAHEGLQSIRARPYGTLEDYRRHAEPTQQSQVIKSAEGATSSGVSLMDGPHARLKLPARLSRSLHLVDAAKNRVKLHLRPWYDARSDHRRKFIVQEFVAGLAGDYKVLVYWDRYYALERSNRKNDFRASGSGLFTYRRDLPEGLLTFAKGVFGVFDVPCMAIDIAWTGQDFIVLEFQFVRFGSYTLEASPFYFVEAAGGKGWTVVEEASRLEDVFARSVVAFLEQRGHARP